ncbi:MAG TPA: PSD1 and planctomycete cytochrome C domain-containing protein [Pirellulales bacterium]|nr:PSD1 and planctomycete cytochrome C domain-containing protein [Pirellulales bacterium]
MNRIASIAAAMFALTAGAMPHAAAAADRVDFDRHIRPILSDKCFFCHGPDQKHRQADLRLDERDSAVADKAIVPGKPEESELIRRITSDDADETMPPPESHKELTPSEKTLLRRWIADGAEYQAHWAYRPLAKPRVPRLNDAGWVRNPIDSFVLEELRSRKIEPSPEADRATLLRRLSLDLTGLPPTPAEVAAFLDDTSPNAYERQVSRLLASPRYGERMAVPWLDLVRFADTVGYHGDQNQHVFAYRDWVIDAFNRNKPFDQFTIEQLAGDLLPAATTEQRVATAFNRLNMMTREGGAQPKEYLAKYAADRVRTVSTTWLGSTMGCCECHGHKFDPFTACDFYSLAAFFADVKQWGYYADAKYARTPELAGFGNEHPFPPEIEVASPYLQRRQRQFEQQMIALAEATARHAAAQPASRDKFNGWQRAMREFLAREPSGWSTPQPRVASKALKPAKKSDADEPEQIDGPTIEADGRIVFRGKPQDNPIALPLDVPWLAAVRLELLPHAAHGGKIARGEPTIIKPAVRIKRRDGKPAKVAFFYADADARDPKYTQGSAVVGVHGGWQPAKARLTERQSSVWLVERPLKVDDGDQLEITLAGNTIGCLRVSVSPIAGVDPLDASLATELRTALGAAESAAATTTASSPVNLAYLGSTACEPKAFEQFRQLQRSWFECRRGMAEVMTTVAVEPLMTRVLPRGNWQDDSGEIVSPAVPHFLPQPTNSGDQRLTRLDLARWLVANENPLTARVVVNRLWKQFFGAALSGVVDDLGAQGESPSHPELLDWLAYEFRASGWDTKRLVRLLVTSSTYRQQSNVRAELRDVDPANRLLAFMSPRRLEAEFVRDNALAIAGLLNLDLGGPSVRPYQPAGYYANLQFPNRDYVAQLDDRQYRRGVYMHWQRTFLQPMLANFDAPGREECTAGRLCSNTPQQALTLLNDPTFVEAARVLAARLLVDAHATDERRIDHLLRLAVARPPSTAERESLAAFLADQRKHYRQHEDEAQQLLNVGIAPAATNIDAAELAAWTSLCRVVLNLHETIARY